MRAAKGLSSGRSCERRRPRACGTARVLKQEIGEALLRKSVGPPWERDALDTGKRAAIGGRVREQARLRGTGDQEAPSGVGRGNTALHRAAQYR